MNANELADELDKCWKYDGELFEKAATMLRQLQAENEALKKQNGQLEFMVGYLEQEVFELKGN